MTEETKFTIKYSDNRILYYIQELVCPFCNWLTVEKFDKKPDNSVFDGGIEYDGGRYYRKFYPFNFSKVQQYKHIEEPISKDDELVKDYVGCGRHKEGLKPFDSILTPTPGFLGSKKSDDKCRWDISKNETECGNGLHGLKTTNLYVGFEWCPYCGRKLKLVDRDGSV